MGGLLAVRATMDSTSFLFLPLEECSWLLDPFKATVLRPRGIPRHFLAASFMTLSNLSTSETATLCRSQRPPYACVCVCVCVGVCVCVCLCVYACVCVCVYVC